MTFANKGVGLAGFDDKGKYPRYQPPRKRN